MTLGRGQERENERKKIASRCYFHQEPSFVDCAPTGKALSSYTLQSSGQSSRNRNDKRNIAEGSRVAGQPGFRKARSHRRVESEAVRTGRQPLSHAPREASTPIGSHMDQSGKQKPLQVF